MCGASTTLIGSRYLLIRVRRAAVSLIGRANLDPTFWRLCGTEMCGWVVFGVGFLFGAGFGLRRAVWERWCAPARASGWWKSRGWRDTVECTTWGGVNLVVGHKVAFGYHSVELSLDVSLDGPEGSGVKTLGGVSTFLGFPRRTKIPHIVSVFLNLSTQGTFIDSYSFPSFGSSCAQAVPVKSGLRFMEDYARPRKVGLSEEIGSHIVRTRLLALPDA
ncbi:hypothetical protein FB567DRAFT_195154 [Paraphoma chrysanthemicola]|uniref:Uncharacterized protein n=1 Tax=Paraphoma chrysanthemicola TaxID=798071 RepID=A0A8K0QW05_9PLEO|nr:hypothetical protein FB567DRAFT_195154 [Paraphoma chrysanthemicola]